MDFWLFRLSLALILLPAGGLIVFLIKQEKQVFTWSLRLLWPGYACLTLWLAAQYMRTGVAPGLSFKAALIFLAWTVLSAYLFLYLKFKLKVLGSCLAPLAAGLLVLSLFFGAPQTAIHPLLKNPWLSLHILFSLLGNGMLSATFAAAILYLLQERQIKQKRIGALFERLPSLEGLDRIGRFALVSGFVLLTAGMITGSVYAQSALGSYWRWDPKEVWTLIVWLIYAVLLHERFAVGLRGRKAAWLAVAAFGVLVFSFIGANFWLSDYHRFENLLRPVLP